MDWFDNSWPLSLFGNSSPGETKARYHAMLGEAVMVKIKCTASGKPERFATIRCSNMPCLLALASGMEARGGSEIQDRASEGIGKK